jgi:hypothetical protein
MLYNMGYSKVSVSAGAPENTFRGAPDHVIKKEKEGFTE